MVRPWTDVMAAAVPTNWHWKALLAGEGVNKDQLRQAIMVEQVAVELGVWVLTLVFGVLERAAQDLKGTGHVERIVPGKEGEQHLDLLNGISAVGGDCTHRE